MNLPLPTVEQLAILAQDVETKDPIDWGMLSIREEDAYKLVASHFLESIASVPEEQRLTIAMATVTKLLVENFVLNVEKYTRIQNENRNKSR